MYTIPIITRFYTLTLLVSLMREYSRIIANNVKIFFMPTSTAMNSITFVNEIVKSEITSIE